MDDVRIDKNTRHIELLLADGSHVEGEVFLSLYGARHSGPQKVIDLLQETSLFLPIKTSTGTILVNRQQIMTVRVAADTELDELMTLGHKRHLRIHTRDRQEIEADIYVDMPTGFGRVMDYLNQPMKYYTFFVPDYVLYIHPQFILSVQD